MKRTLMICAVLLVAAIQLGSRAVGAVVLRNPGFDEGTAALAGHWWAPWDWYTFTICPPDQSDPPPPPEYIWRDCWVGPAGLPTSGEINGFPGWSSLGSPQSPYPFDPTVGVPPADLDHRTCPWVDTSDGYDRPKKVGDQWIKQWQNRHTYSGVAQFIGGLEVGKTYEVSAYGFNSAEVNPPDMRILIDPNGGIDARTAPISSQPVPNRPRGRYWIWSSTGNNRIGDYSDLSSPDVTGCYCIYDKVSVQFMATSPGATIFLLVDGRNWNDYPENDFAVAWDQVSIREVHPPVSTIADARTVPDGTPVTLTNVVVSAVYPSGIYGTCADPCFFVQNEDRSAGIMVLSGRPVSPGDKVNITGEAKTYNGSVAIKATGLTKVGSVNPPKPVATTNAASGGSGVADGLGVSSLGLLSKVWGRVIETGEWIDRTTGEAAYVYALLDDGSSVESATYQPVLNSSFEDFNTNAWVNPYFWSAKKSLDPGSTHIQTWWWHLWDSMVAPHSGRVYVGRIGGLGRAWFYQFQIAGLAPGEPAILKAYGLAGGHPNARVRIGVDPLGGTNQNATSVVWGPYTNTNGMWQELSVAFTAGSGSATVWLESNHTDTTSAQTAFDDVRIYSQAAARKGIKVIIGPPGTWPPSTGEYWSVTGNLWTEIQPGETTPTRLFIPRSAEDIVVH